MLKRAERLAHERDIARVQRSRSKKNADFSLRAARANSSTSRATVIVAKSVSKKAVDRNRLKRQTRAIITKPLRALIPALDIVISVKPAAKTKSFSELRRSLLSLWPSNTR